MTIGRILKPHGIQGKVRVQSLTDVPGRFEEIEHVRLMTPSGQSLVTTVNTVRKTGQFYLIGLSAFSSPEDAGEFRGAWIQIPKGEVPPLPPFQYYQFELIGLEVQDETGQVLGKLEDVVELPHQHVFVVQNGKNELLIPAVRQIVSQVDLQRRIMTVAPLEQ